MQSLTRLRLLPLRPLTPTTHRLLSSTPLLRNSKEGNEPDWVGRGAEEHVTNRGDELDIHAAASKSGQRDRANDSNQSSAASERDNRKDNERAKKDMPEAPPGPVIGMNDERGGKGH
ncbi:hypothetical protein MMC24_002715 [Lignoscripta atroalba]|nr:hypothetical protein [Lignoscripta atroalba]